MKSSRRRRAVLLSAATALASALTARAAAPLPAFSGADGAGGDASGGRGGVVYHVTRLDSDLGDNGPGTLQYGLNDANFKNASGAVIPRTIVFDVGGTIWLGNKTTDTEGFDTANRINVGTDVTIAGQTAPGGITIAGGSMKVNGTTTSGNPIPFGNDIIRNISLAPGYGTRKLNSTTGYADQYTYDAMDVNASNVIVDHVSAVFATDETISAKDLTSNLTIQYTSMSQGQDYPQIDAEASGTVYAAHALGSLISPASNSTISILHDLYADQSTRLPAVQTETEHLTQNAAGAYIPGLVDVRNNVIYNWLGNAGYGDSGEPGNVNLVNNFYKVGPGGDTATNTSDPSIVHANGGTSVFNGSPSTDVYQSGNVRLNLNGSSTNLTNANFGPSAFQAAPNSVPYTGVTDSAATAYTQVLDYVGANWQNRDEIDSRIISQVADGAGQITAFDDSTHGYNSAGQYVSNSTGTEWDMLLALRGPANGGSGATGALTRPANYDTDGDGMPDSWEIAMGLNPSAADNNGSVDRDGYTNLEKYLNELAAFPASTPLIFNNANADTRYAEIGNWQTGVCEPSRYDTAEINAGSATIDVPGQHAGTLLIGATPGGTASLQITSGWIDIAQSLQIAPTGSGSVTQSGGIVHAVNSVVLGGSTNPGSYTLSAGTLATPLLTLGPKGGTFSFTGGVLHTDHITFSLTNNGGTLAPGSDLSLQQIAAAAMPDINDFTYAPTSLIGHTTIDGDLTLSSGSLEIQLASPGSFDSLSIDNLLTLGGSLNVQLLNGYTPLPNDRWLIGTASAITGSFASITPGYAVQSLNGDLYLTAIPEPTTTTLLTAAVAGLLLLPRRGRRSSRPFHS